MTVYVLRDGRIVSEHRTPATLIEEVDAAIDRTVLQIISRDELVVTAEGRAALRRWLRRETEN